MYILIKTEFISTCSSVSLAPVENEMDEWIPNTKLAFLHLKNTLWRRREMCLKTKIRIYQTAVRSIYLNECETWPFNLKTFASWTHWPLVPEDCLCGYRNAAFCFFQNFVWSAQNCRGLSPLSVCHAYIPRQPSSKAFGALSAYLRIRVSRNHNDLWAHHPSQQGIQFIIEALFDTVRATVHWR